ncbi:AAA family ATPase [Salinicoccus roseus]|uniref:AAA family ATPase n=1 Tax=Salinicoccus roseus TaxID=45670 RepID=UPI0035656773
MKIKKVYIKNFKGIQNKTIVDFSEDVTLLLGPNGFGKTTVFDVIELALTGEIYRTRQKKVTNHYKDYLKPYFQNNIEKPVILKLWLENNQKEELIIVKYYDKDASVTDKDKKVKRNKPEDFSMLKTYEDNKESFEEEQFLSEGKRELSQKEIEDFFQLDNEEFSLSEIYKLFNYLQQEETTYFLKMSEDKRKEGLGFLFQTSYHEEKLEKINNSLYNLRSTKNTIESALEKVDRTFYQNDVDYKPAFPSKSFSFDKIEPFEEVSREMLEYTKDKYIDEVRNLISFKESFSPQEYIKKTKIDYINKHLVSNDFLDYIILAYYLDTPLLEYLKKENDIRSDHHYIDSFILQDFKGQSESIIQENKEIKKYKAYKAYLHEQKKNFSSENTDSLYEIIEEFCKSEKGEINSLLAAHKATKESMRTVDYTVKEIINLRINLFEKHEEINDHHNCPFCGFSWESHSKLKEEYNNKEKELKSLIDEQSQNLLEIERQINMIVIIPSLKKIEDFLGSNNYYNEELVKHLQKIEKLDLNFDLILDYLSNEEILKYKLKSLVNQNNDGERKISCVNE